MRRHRLAVVVAALVATTAFVIGQGKTDPTLNKLAAEWEAAFNAKDAAKLGSMYAEDAVLMPAGEPMIRGRANIQARFKKDMDAGATIQLKPFSSEIVGDMGYEAGASVVKTKEGTMNEKYLVVLRRSGTEWKIIHDIYNSDKAPQ